MEFHDVWHTGNSRDRRDVAEKVEVESFIERGVDRTCVRDQQERVTIGICIYDQLRRDVAAPTWAVLDDELLTQASRQPLTNKARKNVITAAGGSGDDDAHRAGRIGLCPATRRCKSTEDADRPTLQNLTTIMFHGVHQ